MSTELLDSIDEVVEAPTPEETPAPETEPVAKEPEQKVEAKKEPEKESPKAEPKKEHTIPVATYVEERKQWQAEKKALEERLAKLENPPKAPEPEPDYAEDPKKYVDHKLQSALKQLESGVTEAKQSATAATQQAIEARFMQDMASLEAEFVKQTPDYFDALGHLRTVRATQLRAFEPNITDEQIRDVILREERTLAFNLARQGRNPAQIAYQLAQIYGYAKKEPPKEELKLPEVKGPKQLPPDQTLGSGSGPVTDTGEDEGDEFDDAFKEMFKPRKRA